MNIILNNIHKITFENSKYALCSKVDFLGLTSGISKYHQINQPEQYIALTINISPKYIKTKLFPNMHVYVM